ncbi:glucosaminidase domain-containing protein [Mucilaginibacter mali]|uniref:Glucosaminidase domain-containing protein n=1 Tax=Mucilaginibacter mali TaxID=2740462 RepID=A0A7D4Q0K5_9SPHI|nr:glucosaminidase domain-containing protein [Mucilaginibacter mali]QKJ28427.1 glucosaminidase domain-containing protein [Mucilaginibacter mali]
MAAPAYISSIAPSAQKAVAGTGLHASVMIAQAALESGNGQSLLARKYNNHFGVKAGSGWSGGAVRLDSAEVRNGRSVMEKSPFRVYSSAADSFADQVKLLQGSHYRAAGVTSAATPEAEAQALQKAGYATDPQYAAKLIAIINQYNLKQYDGAHAAQSGSTPAGASQKKSVLAMDKTKIIYIAVAALIGLILYAAYTEI